MAVNRFWEQCFGRGLVDTSEDFGLQGARPSHARLLDALAASFVDSGWDVKDLFREIVLSKTFCQSSVVRKQQLEIDPENRWLSRGPRFRMDAEVIRDSRLFAAGLLDLSAGKRGVKPPQPAGLWKPVSQPNSTTAHFVADKPDRQFRRSVYMFWKRTSPPAMMQTFDAPNRDACVISRQRTNTPLQALALMNDYQNLQCANALAMRLLKEQLGDEANDDSRLALGFELATGRSPSDTEAQMMRKMLRSLRAAWKDKAESAGSLVKWSDCRRLDAKHRDPPELAAWIMVCNALLNLSESVTVQ